MAKDPKKLNPENPYSKTYPGQDLNTGVLPNTTDLLPAIFRTETNKKVLSAVVEDLFQPSSIETLNYSIGRSQIKSLGADYLPHPTARRQLETGLVVFSDTGAAVLTADNIATGFKLNDRENETVEPLSILDLPIDPDKFLNWADYHWIEERMPIVFLTSGTSTTMNIQQDVVGSKYYTTPVQVNGRSLEFKNGMRVAFQQHPAHTDIDGDLDLDLIADGTDQILLDYEFVNYDRNMIGVSVNGVVKTPGTDYFISGNAITWKITVQVESIVHLHAPDFYTVKEAATRLRTWLVTGVGTEEGIQLLGLHSQTTSTVYSKLTSVLWDQSAVPWDRTEWDGFIPGINPKEYILQAPGAKNRNAHSRTNCWIHWTVIQTVINFLQIRFDDIAKAGSKAIRPIVEFENTLELFNHGTRYRAWPTFLVNEPNVSINDFLQLPLTNSNTVTLNSRYMTLLSKLNRPVDIVVQTQIGENFKLALNAMSVNDIELNKILINLDNDNEAGRIPKYAVYKIVGNQIVWVKNAPTTNDWTITYRISGVLLSALRILWLCNDSNANSILNIKYNTVQTTTFNKEEAHDGDAVVINVTASSDPHYLREYHWANGIATLATFRKTAIQQPLFEIYSRAGIRLSDITDFKPTVVNSNIIKIIAGKKFDDESGYSLNFSPTQFTQLSADNIAADSMYNILFEHTLQTPSMYTNSSGAQDTVYGPYSFRRIANSDTISELSNGYRRAWFKLKSWAIRSVKINGETTIQLDQSMWPTYNWAISVNDNVGTVLHTDDFEQVVDNSAVGARGHAMVFKVYHSGVYQTATITGQGFDSFSVPMVDNTIEFTVPATALFTLNVSIGPISITTKLIELANDPRFVKMSLDNMPIAFTADSTTYTVLVTGTGTVEIKHQGNQAPADHLTAIPGLDYNPEQLDNFGEINVARLVNGLAKNIAINTGGTREWIATPKFKTLDGIYMADNSAMRSSWAKFGLLPTLQDVVVARSMSAWRWYRKFISKLEESNRLYDIETIGIANALDRILGELLLGINYSSADAVSGMAFTREGMQSNIIIAAGETTFDIGSTDLFTNPYAADHVYVYVDDTIQLRKVSYTIVNQQVVFVTAPPIDSIVKIYFAGETEIYSAIPASPAKLGLSGLYQPGFVTEAWGEVTKTFIQRHDGSRISAYNDPETGLPSLDNTLNAVILEFETRIYNACVNTVGQENRQQSFRNYANSEVTESQARSQLEWYALNGLNYRDRSDFDAVDSWTWNYNGNSWRRLYINRYGTYRLDTSPWEALGFDSMPTWWATHYSWAEASKRTALENALYFGIVSEPTTPVTTDPNFVRPYATFPVDENGMLLSPFDAGIASPSVTEAQQPWEIGSMGTAEMAWRRSISGTWSDILHIIDDYKLVHKFIDSAINPFINTVKNNSTAPKGTGSIAPDQFLYTRPLIGIGAVLFEGYREFNLLGESPLDDLLSVATKLEFSVGGFTDGNISLKMPYSKFQDTEYVPNDDFGLTLTKGTPMEQLRYTSVRIETDDVGFRVYGFDPGQRYFKVLIPTAEALSNSYPTTRRQLPTSFGTFVEYLSWNNVPTTVAYGSYIANKQDLITFLMGLGEYQTQQGLVLDSLNNRGTITDWKQAALDSLNWIEERWGNDHYCVVGVATTDGLKIQHTMGILCRLDADLGRTGKVLYANGRSATASELLITRDFELSVDKVSPLVDEQIVFVNFEIQNYDHVFFINKKTKFGDLIADLQADNRLEDLTISGRRTYNWNGRPHAPGVIPQQYTTLPGFDTLVGDIVASHMPERIAFDTAKTDIARGNVVPTKKSVLVDIIQDSASSYLYQQGLQSAAGTNLGIDALFRNRNIDIPGNTQDVSVNEQWMFSTGEFGNLANKKIWEIELRKTDITSNRQIVRFRDAALGVSDLKADNIIDIVGKADPRWVSRPSNYNFKTIDRNTIDQTYSKSNNWLPSAGLANVVDTDIEIMQLSDLSFNKILEVERSKTLFETQSFSLFNDYNTGDHAWNQGKLYKATVRIVGSGTGVFDPNQWTEVAVAGSMLPSIWVSDYGFTLEQGVVAASDSNWTAEKSYIIGNVVSVNGNYYKCVEANTQSAFSQIELLDVLILDGGSNYGSADTISITPQSGVGSGATASLTVKNGFISSVDVTTIEKYRIDTTTICNNLNQTVATVSFDEIETVDVVDATQKQLGTISGLSIGNNYDPEYFSVQLVLSIGATDTILTDISPTFGSKVTPGNKTGIISTFRIGNAGTGYRVNDIVTADNAGKGYDATFKVTAIETENVQATATATIEDVASATIPTKEVKTISIVNGGAGYITAPTVTISAPTTGTAATATAVIANGTVTGFTITNRGSGYTTAPTVTIGAPTDNRGSIKTLDMTYAGAFYELDEYPLTSGASIVVTLTETTSGSEYIQTNVLTGIAFNSTALVSNAITTGTLIVKRKPQDLLNGNTEYRRAQATIVGTVITGVSLTNTIYSSGSTGFSTAVTVTVQGDGTGAVVTPVFTNNKLTSFVVTAGGVGYSYANIVVNDPDWANDTLNEPVTLVKIPYQTGATFSIGRILEVISITSGDGYTIDTPLKIVDTSGYNTKVTGATVDSVTNGVISDVTLSNVGMGYSIPPTLTINSSTGSGASLSVDSKTYWEILPQGYSWNVVQAFSPAYIEEICPNAFDPGLNESKVSFADPHKLVAGNTFIITGCNDGNYDTVHKVKAVVDDYNVLIAARSTSDTIVYNAVSFKLNSVKFKTDEEFLNSSLVFSTGMKAYIDYGDIEGRYKIYEFTGDGRVNLQNYQAEYYSNTMIDTQSIYQVKLFDYRTAALIETLEVFDPYKGLTIDEVAQFIDFKQLPDPAIYNVTELGQFDEYSSAPWGKAYVGKLWWDLSKVRYIEYEQSGDIQYRATHWGERFANSEVAVYEWVASLEQPTVETAPTAYLDTSGNSAGQIRYSEITTTDPVTGATQTTYYHWNRSPAIVPPGGVRTYSAAAIESVLNSPDANGVAWFAPIDTNAFIISNIAGAFAGKDQVVLRIEQNLNPEQAHYNSVLVTENVDIINDYLYHRLEASIVGRDNYRESYELKEYVIGRQYKKGDYLYVKNNGEIIATSNYDDTDYPILQRLEDIRYDINSVRQSKNSADHKIYVVSAEQYVATGINNDLAARNLIKSAASALINDPYENTDKYYAVINTRRRVPDSSLHPLRRYGNAYAPKPQSWFKDIMAARRTLTVAANEYLLNIDTVSKTDWDRYLRTYKPLSGAYSKDLTKYWYYTDYVVAGYTVGSEELQITANEISSIAATVTSFAVVDNYGTILESYTKSGNNVTLMYRKNGTIQFSNAIWDGSLGDAWDRAKWDSASWDEDASEVLESILRALRKNIFVGTDIGYFNKLFFALVKESMNQIPNADWVVKTTYLDVFQTSTRELEKIGTYYNKKDKLIIKYINEVKPYHSKIVEANKLNNARQDIPVTVNESVTLTILTTTAIVTENRKVITAEDGKNLATKTGAVVKYLVEE
jgi:hypothetical protein